ncbi:hypothetical protein LP52_02460 [Streptomonospora alba]|uniref:HTH luxR-type domain-containing protein n=2 Tax=Streptomonospora alba TaxID=183763 RepID=A0A0C2JFW5_9ACTN|nr:hypothetical protein LP52_02460 [Streptomonospora alba]
MVRGREEELAALRAALAAEGGRLIVLKGPVGIGKTALLDETERTLRAAGTRVLPVRMGSGPGGRDDAFGLGPLVRAVRDRFEQFQAAGLAASLNTVARLSDAVGRETGGWAPSLVPALDSLFAGLAQQGRTVVLADDAHAVAEPAPMIAAARRSGCLVLAACDESAEHALGPGELLAAADQVVTLGPVSDDVAESLLRRTPGPRLDEAVPGILRTALGPLFGNPGTLLATLADLRERGRLTPFGGRLCLHAPSEPVELPGDHHLLRRVASLGDLAAHLLTAVSVLDGISVDDLPLLTEMTGSDLTAYGRVLDRMIEAQVLIADPVGRVGCRCPALAASAVGWAANRCDVSLHTLLAEQILARQPDAVDPAVLAGHIAGSGSNVVLDASQVSWLLGLAADDEPERPERAASSYAAALPRLPPSDPQHPPTLTRLVNLVVRTGRHELLRDVLAQYTEQGCARGSLEEVRLAAIMAALHSGEPPADEAVRSLLDAGPTGAEPIGFAQWWFGLPRTPGPVTPYRSRLVPADRMEVLSAALSGDFAACERAWHRSGGAATSRRGLDRLHHAAAMVDTATVMRLVLGDHYRIPTTGVPGVHRRVVRGYNRADWSQAMSAVRELELSYSTDTLAHQAARLLAADMCAARGESRQAAWWLGRVVPSPQPVAMRAWVRIGLFSRAGDHRRAVRLALRAGRRLRRSGPHVGLFLLLIRAVQIAVSIDDRHGAAELLEETELLCRETGTDTQEALLLARGLVHRDVELAESATELTREREDLPSLLDSCLAIARFAEDPRPWLREAHELATRCGASVLLEHIRAVARERGVPAPRVRGRGAQAVTEQRIVELVGEGLTNGQIALRLQLSEKTVENHLTRLFARTGCRSRVELAAVSLGGRLTRD